MRKAASGGQAADQEVLRLSEIWGEIWKKQAGKWVYDEVFKLLKQYGVVESYNIDIARGGIFVHFSEQFWEQFEEQLKGGKDLKEAVTALASAISKFTCGLTNPTEAKSLAVLMLIFTVASKLQELGRDEG